MTTETATEVDDFLEHYGVKGMKWGKRRGGSVRDKFKSAAKERADRSADRFQRLYLKENLNRRETLAYNINRATMGRKRSERLYKQNAIAFMKQSDRISSGKATMRDKLDAVYNTPLIDVLFERQS